MSDSAPTPPCAILPWDSEFFGVQVARVCRETLDAALADQVDRWCIDHRVDCLYFAARSDDPATSQLAEERGFRLMDVRTTFERPIAAGPAPAGCEGLRDATENDLPALVRIARAAHTDTRFWADPHFGVDKSAALYERWILNSFRGFAQAVRVAEHEKQPAGYITCHLKPGADEASIGLIAVAEDARGRGLARRLVQGSLAWAAAHGARRMSVVTQARNIAAQRLYQTCGFVTRSVELVFHKWYPRKDSP